MKTSNIGGQAVIEGIMMKNKQNYAVAVRKPDGEIAVEIDEYIGFGGKSKLFTLPLLRGVFGFIDSMVLGMKTLTFSAGFFEEDEAEENQGTGAKGTGGSGNDFLMVLVVIVSMALAIGLFMVLPLLIASVFRPYVTAGFLAVLEGVIRISLFVGYVLLISRMDDIKRTFMYHGAEHKCINCIEQGLELTVANVRKSSKQHKRCGTSFMFFVMFISIILFFFIRVDGIWMRIVSRIVLIPVIAGLSYEVIRLAGRSESILVRILSAPGMWLQKLTTKEPDDSMIEVAIKAVEAVFDWQAFQKENF